MIVCHCLNITDRDIHAAIDWMRAADPETIITPGKIYHALGARPDCGSCMPLFLSTMRKNKNLEVPVELTGLRQPAMKGRRNEGRR
ncbi:(2Fe-2S)-binding protein [Rhodobacter sp. TJ_12]|uniref:(2Fe-2S)-binding protein n=1 Tax=Rhodobacter sp. TJ_12 TaxID=2029399 RepID=UPI001CBEBF4B|nr:(2Fe-2S)-binding protein [Rhodobacter sp. TJ_12]MBZ4023756.1 (2Fe-2S)-binding protein [Rhodobacter sp. TJ_12]